MSNETAFINDSNEVFHFRRIIPFLFSVGLVLCIFLPWFSYSSFGSSISVSGIDLNEKLIFAAVAGGAISMIASFVKSFKVKGVIHLLTAMLIIILIIAMSPQKTSGINASADMIFDAILKIATFGFYLFVISLLGLFISGLVEIIYESD